MNYPFFLYGYTMKLFAYSVTYQEPAFDENNELTGETETVVEGCPTRQWAERRAEETGGTITELDTTPYEWLDGITVPESTNPMAEAVKIYEMGREAWEARQNAPTAEDRMAQMEADIAYLAMLTDTDLEA